MSRTTPPRVAEVLKDRQRKPPEHDTLSAVRLNKQGLATRVRFELPFPPSLNRMYRMVNNRFLISKVGRGYQAQVEIAIKQLPIFPLLDDERLSVSIIVYPPDKRARDLDNLTKCLLDSLGKGMVYLDDSQVDRLLIERGEVVKLGKVHVTIEVL